MALIKINFRNTTLTKTADQGSNKDKKTEAELQEVDEY